MAAEGSAIGRGVCYAAAFTLACTCSTIRFDSQLAQLLGVDLTRCAGHQVGCPLRLGKSNAIADIGHPSKQHDQAVQSQGDSAVRRRAVLQRIEQESESSAGRRLVDAQQAGHLPPVLIDALGLRVKLDSVRLPGQGDGGLGFQKPVFDPLGGIGAPHHVCG